MTGNVVKLPRRDGASLVWVCACGSTTHYHHADGSVVCGSCETPATSLNGDWRLRFPEEPPAPTSLDHTNFKVADFDTVEVFMKRQLKVADGRPIAAAVVMFSDGSFATWGREIETPKQQAWLRRKLVEAGRRMTGGAGGAGR